MPKGRRKYRVDKISSDEGVEFYAKGNVAMFAYIKENPWVISWLDDKGEWQYYGAAPSEDAAIERIKLAKLFDGRWFEQ